MSSGLNEDLVESECVLGGGIFSQVSEFKGQEINVPRCREQLLVHQPLTSRGKKKRG